MNSSTVAGNSNSAGPGFISAPPPPPPPPATGSVPAQGYNSLKAQGARRPNGGGQDSYEPPAAIQNAMMTKDKKPFTYTPGMGGKLDLSQIRSPRMARRVAKNANDEGIEGPPKSALEAKTSPTQCNPNIYIQPQVAVPVFPANMPPQPTPNRLNNNVNHGISNAPNRHFDVPNIPIKVEKAPSVSPSINKPDPPCTMIKIEPKITTSPQPSSPETPTSPTQVTLSKAPTPWMQKAKQAEELPEWAKRSSLASNESSSPTDTPGITYVQIQPTQPAQQQAQQRQQFHSHPQQQFENQPTHSTQRQQPPSPQRQPQQRMQPSPTQQERVVPLRIEDRPSVFSAKNEPGHHQIVDSTTPHHQSRWYQPQPQNNHQPQPVQNRQQQNPPPIQQPGGGFIIPIMVEGAQKNSRSPITPNIHPQQQIRNVPIETQVPRNVSRGPTQIPVQHQQAEPGPVQSKSFRVLQKITDTDDHDEVDGDQLRKLQLTEDDRVLMNKFKDQVDGDNYLHQEEDPRYRGAAIPSRAFRYLQNMTDAGEVTSTATTPKAVNAAIRKQNRNSKSFEDMQANLPPSEQQAPEPKKYMGGAIPSRSFRILQAMTAPESTGPDTTDY